MLHALCNILEVPILQIATCLFLLLSKHVVIIIGTIIIWLCYSCNQFRYSTNCLPVHLSAIKVWQASLE